MRKVKKGRVRASMRKMIRKIFVPHKKSKFGKNLGCKPLPTQTSSMVVVIDQILDERRKKKKPPFSFKWIRNN